MKNRIIIFGTLFVFVIANSVALAMVLDQKDTHISEYHPGGFTVKSNSSVGPYSYEEVVSIFESNLPQKFNREEIEKALSKMDDILVNASIGSIENASVNQTTFSLNVLIESETEEAADNLVRGLSRLIQWEMHNGLKGIDIPRDESLPRNIINSEIIGLRGIGDLITALNDDFSSFARLR